MKKLKFSSLKLGLSVLLIFVSNTQLNSQWVSQSSGVSSQLLSVYFVNQAIGFACGVNGKVLKTTNGGANWQASTVLDTSHVFTSLHFINPVTGFIAGRILILGQTFVAKPIILKTTNGGGTWNSLLSDSGYTLRSVYFINENTGFASGGLYGAGPNKFLTTTNGGSSWEINSFLAPGYLYSVSFHDMNTGFTVSSLGTIYRTTNSGQNWNFLASLIDELHSIIFLTSEIGFSTGGGRTDSSGHIYKSVNGGTNWNLVYTDNLGKIDQLKFANSNIGFAVGHIEYQPLMIPSRIIKTTNSGDNWYVDTVFSNIGGLTSLFFTDQNTGYAVGSNGVILKTTTGGNPIGIKPGTGELPIEFSLSQNYPNPFNPSTKIRFDIPATPLSSIGEGPGVRLTIYDILGRKVTALVNEQLKPGTYEVEWDAGDYSSGVYFYTLQTESFSETKKMVLIK